jgi:predicted transcriptional regulator
MAGLDRLLAKSLDIIIRQNLGDRTIQKIEDRLFEKYGLSLTQSIEQFQKLDAVLREFFGAGADGLEQRFIKEVCEIKSINGENWVSIDNQTLTRIILESFGDDDKKKILSTLNGHALIISEIIEKCNIPQTSGYRKINSLIDAGLLIQDGHVVTADGKRVTKYRSILDNVKIDIIKNKVTTTLHLSKQDFISSTVLAVCS